MRWGNYVDLFRDVLTAIYHIGRTALLTTKDWKFIRNGGKPFVAAYGNSERHRIFGFSGAEDRRKSWEFGGLAPSFRSGIDIA